jgi:phage gpG-like protein
MPPCGGCASGRGVAVAEFLRIDITGNAELLASLDRALRRIEQPRDLLDRLGARLVANIQERFDRKVDPDGRAWAPLAPSTLARYEAQDKGRRRGTLLERTGQMRASLSANSGPDYVEVGMARLTDKGGRWAIPLLHETGTRRMPRRGMFLSNPDTGTLGAEDDAMLDEEITAYLDEVFG